MRSLLFLLLALTASTVFAWGYPGHEVVGSLADQLLTPVAKKKLQEVAGISLRSASKWPDCVKGVTAKDNAFKYEANPRYDASCREFQTPDGIREMEEYAARNWDSCSQSSNAEPCHRQFHYTNIAFQHDKYDRASSGTNDHDIVSAINAAIGVLQGKPAPAPFNIRSPREALFLLAHLIGDIHQPLHAGAVYLDSAGDPIDPDLSGEPFDQKTSTRGGNFIAVGSISLHAFWDEIPSSIKPDRITERMLTNAKAVGKTPGPVGSWSTTWATETLVVSKPVFEGLTYVPDPNKPGRWTAEFKDRKAYLKEKNRLDREQLVRAGARLAQVLNEVWK